MNKSNNVRNIYVLLLATCGLLLPLGSSVKAQSITYSDSVSLQSTDWTGLVEIPQFDPSLGTLERIDFRLKAIVESTSQFENLGNNPITVTLLLQTNVELQRPNHSLIVDALANVFHNESVVGYDGTTDFAGDSGTTFQDQIEISHVLLLPPSADDLALFTGTGNLFLPVLADVASSATASGDVVLGYTTQAAAEIDVTYNYLAIPEPNTLVLALTGLASLTMLTKSRFNA